MRPRSCFGDEALSYRELDRRSNQLAHHLRALGVGPEVVVGLCVERSPAMVVGVLGILKAGGAYLPLDPAYPADRLSYMLERCGRAGPGDAVGTGRSACGAGRAASSCSMPRRMSIARQPASAPALSARPAASRLRDLHLGLDRPAEGRGRDACGHSQPRGSSNRTFRHHVGRACPAVRLAELRCRNFGNRHGAAFRCDPRHSRCGAQRRRAGAPDPAAGCYARDVAACRAGRLAGGSAASDAWSSPARPARPTWWRAGRRGGGCSTPMDRPRRPSARR